MNSRNYKLVALPLAWFTGVVLGLAGLTVILDLSKYDAVVLIVLFALFVISTFFVTLYEIKALFNQR